MGGQCLEQRIVVFEQYYRRDFQSFQTRWLGMFSTVMFGVIPKSKGPNHCVAAPLFEYIGNGKQILMKNSQRPRDCDVYYANWYLQRAMIESHGVWHRNLTTVQTKMDFNCSFFDIRHTNFIKVLSSGIKASVCLCKFSCDSRYNKNCLPVAEMKACSIF